MKKRLDKAASTNRWIYELTEHDYNKMVHERSDLQTHIALLTTQNESLQMHKKSLQSKITDLRAKIELRDKLQIVPLSMRLSELSEWAIENGWNVNLTLTMVEEEAEE